MRSGIKSMNHQVLKFIFLAVVIGAVFFSRPNYPSATADLLSGSHGEALANQAIEPPLFVLPPVAVSAGADAGAGTSVSAGAGAVVGTGAGAVGTSAGMT